MANLKDIKRQIKSVQNTQKTTKAMKLVSTAKLRLAEQAAKEAKAYELKINEVLREISYELSAVGIGDSNSKFFERVENPKVVDIICVTADKGLCGGFNFQTIKTVQDLISKYKESNTKIRLRVIGKKGIAFFKFQGIEIEHEYKDVSSSPTAKKAGEIICEVVAEFKNGKTDEVVLVSNGYKNMITQEIKVLNLLPVKPIDFGEDGVSSLIETEPSDSEVIFRELLEKYVEFNMYYALIDSLAAEHSARMQAMDTASNNANDKVNSLTLSYNKARQEVITTELIEIISGVEALK